MSESAKHRVPPYRRPLIVGGVLLILAVVIVITILIFKNTLGAEEKPANPANNPTTSQPSSSQGDSEPSTKEPPLENKAPQYEGGDPNELDSLTGVITYADIDAENQVLHSAVSINQYLEADGQCVFNLKRNDAIVRTASAVATADVTTSVCGPFSISVAGLDPGLYQIEIIMTDANRRGIINSEVNI